MSQLCNNHSLVERFQECRRASLYTQLVSYSSKVTGSTYSDQSGVGDIDLPLALGSRGRQSDSEVLIRGQSGLVVSGAERSVVQDSAQNIRCATARCSGTGGETDYNGNLGRSAQSVLHR
jgi:hypothetical protein